MDIKHKRITNIFQTPFIQNMREGWQGVTTCWLRFDDNKHALLTLSGRLLKVGQSVGDLELEKKLSFLQLIPLLGKMLWLQIVAVKFCSLSTPVLPRCVLTKTESWGTIVVDIDKKDNEMLQSFNPEVRTKINKCFKSAVKFNVCNSIHEFNDYCLPVFNQYKFATPRTLEQAKFMWDCACQNDCEFFYTTFNDKVLAIGGGIASGDSVTGIFSTTTKDAYALKLGAMEYLNFNMFRYYRDRGVKTFDLAGINPTNTASDKEKGIRSFKMKFGGKQMELINQTLYSPLYPFYKLILPFYLLLRKCFTTLGI